MLILREIQNSIIYLPRHPKNQSLHFLLPEQERLHVDVTIKDGIASYNGRVEFRFQIDQSYLPELIEQLKHFIEANR